MRCTLLLVAAAMTTTAGEAQTCVGQNANPPASAASVDLSNAQLSSALSAAAAIWNNCGSDGVPNVVANGTGTITVAVTHLSGQSNRADGACGQGQAVIVDGRVPAAGSRCGTSGGPTRPESPPGPTAALISPASSPMSSGTSFGWVSLDYSIDEAADDRGNVQRLRGSYRRRIVDDGPARYGELPMHAIFFRSLSAR